MKLLKEKVMEVVDSVNQNWVNATNNEAKESKKFSYAEMMGKFSEQIKHLNKHFLEYEERNKKKGGFFK